MTSLQPALTPALAWSQIKSIVDVASQNEKNLEARIQELKEQLQDKDTTAGLLTTTVEHLSRDVASLNQHHVIELRDRLYDMIREIHSLSEDLDSEAGRTHGRRIQIASLIDIVETNYFGVTGDEIVLRTLEKAVRKLKKQFLKRQQTVDHRNEAAGIRDLQDKLDTTKQAFRRFVSETKDAAGTALMKLNTVDLEHNSSEDQVAEKYEDLKRDYDEFLQETKSSAAVVLHELDVVDLTDGSDDITLHDIEASDSVSNISDLDLRASLVVERRHAEISDDQGSVQGGNTVAEPISRHASRLGSECGTESSGNSISSSAERRRLNREPCKLSYDELKKMLYSNLDQKRFLDTGSEHERNTIDTLRKDYVNYKESGDEENAATIQNAIHSSTIRFDKYMARQSQNEEEYKKIVSEIEKYEARDNNPESVL